jgi:hypothetical protein
MSFWLRQRLLVRLIGMLSPFWCYGIALVIGAVCAGVLLVKNVLPSQDRLAVLRGQLDNLERQVAAFEAVLDQRQALQDEHNKLVAKKKEFVSDICLLQDALNDLLLVARDYAVSCRGILQFCSKRESFHGKHIVTVRGKGRFAEVISLLKAFEQPRYPVTVRGILLTKTRGKMVAFDATLQVISAKEG